MIQQVYKRYVREINLHVHKGGVDLPDSKKIQKKFSKSIYLHKIFFSKSMIPKSIYLHKKFIQKAYIYIKFFSKSRIQKAYIYIKFFFQKAVDLHKKYKKIHINFSFLKFSKSIYLHKIFQKFMFFHAIQKACSRK